MAKASAQKQQQEKVIEVQGLSSQTVEVWVLGRSPLLLHAVSAKVNVTLLLGGHKKTGAEKADIKHHPYQEFQDAAYIHASPETRLCFPGGGMRRAISTAALETAGTTKKQIERLMWIEEHNIPIWGIPEIHMAIVRNADINRTPDVRTRCILVEWCARFKTSFIAPTLHAGTVAMLLGNAGLVIGIGDNRQEKGAGSNGQFEIVEANDERVAKLVNTCGLAAQDAALADPAPYDEETRRMLEIYKAEVSRREGGAV